MSCRDDSEGDLSDVTESPKDEAEVLRGRSVVPRNFGPIVVLFYGSIEGWIDCIGSLRIPLFLCFSVGSWRYDVFDFR